MLRISEGVGASAAAVEASQKTQSKVEQQKQQLEQFRRDTAARVAAASGGAGSASPSVTPTAKVLVNKPDTLDTPQTMLEASAAPDKDPRDVALEAALARVAESDAAREAAIAKAAELEKQVAHLTAEIDQLHEHAEMAGAASARAAARKAKANAAAVAKPQANGGTASSAENEGAADNNGEAPSTKPAPTSAAAAVAGTGSASAASSALSRLRKASSSLTHTHASKLASALATTTKPAALGSLAASASTHTGPVEAPAPGSLQKAMGEVRGVNGMNAALWALGVFKHEPPKFEYFDPEDTEHLAIIFKEVRVPRAEQTHEVVFEPLTKCLFVSQMSNSVLVRIPVADDGLLLDDQDAWRVGPQDDNGNGLGGLHNLSLSKSHPGCLWVSLQFCNEVMLVEAATMKLLYIFKVPTMLVRDDKTAIRVGGPHCVRECSVTGEIWVALKGSIACHPAETPDRVEATHGNHDSKSLKRAKERVCCSAKALKARMAQLEDLGYNSPPPEGFAIWRLKPANYDPDAPDGACGGKLYETKPSPPMMTLDHDCNCWSAQDQDKCMVMINSRTDEVVQVDVPHPVCCRKMDMMITGPAIATAPDGGVWCSLLGANGGLARVDPTTKERTLYEFSMDNIDWIKTQRIIHLAFHTVKNAWYAWRPSPDRPYKRIYVDTFNVMFVISSNLVDDDALNMMAVYGFWGTEWIEPMWYRCIPLPTQDCSCHRITVVDEGLAPEEQSVVVSCLHSSKLFQVKLANLFGSGMNNLVSVAVRKKNRESLSAANEAASAEAGKSATAQSDEMTGCMAQQEYDRAKEEMSQHLTADECDTHVDLGKEIVGTSETDGTTLYKKMYMDPGTIGGAAKHTASLDEVAETFTMDTKCMLQGARFMKAMYDAYDAAEALGKHCGYASNANIEKMPAEVAMSGTLDFESLSKDGWGIA